MERDIWNGILLKRARKQELKVDEKVLKDSMIRSLFREYAKQFMSGDPTLIEIKDRLIRDMEKKKEYYLKEYLALQDALYKKFGLGWSEILKED